MPKYLWQVSYAAEGTRGVLSDGGSKRRAVAADALKAVGGKLEVFYFAFGDSDAFLIADMPDNVSVAAASMAVNASGAVQVKTTVLLTPEEMDAATKKTVRYSPPGMQ
ncbi:MAG: GYD domain-containing protein [Acidobacteria bacterium]|nr:GYD domain-containing protein [Acidobacteriota bacterium]